MMKIFGRTAIAAGLIAAGVVIGGCKNNDKTEQPQAKLYNADQFQPNEPSRSVWQVSQRQVTASARESATLTSADFDDSNQLSEVGRARLEAILADRADLPPTLYINLPMGANPAAVQQRRAAVENYLRDSGALADSGTSSANQGGIQIRMGPNPQQRTLASEGIMRLPRTESITKDSDARPVNMNINERGGGTGR